MTSTTSINGEVRTSVYDAIDRSQEGERDTHWYLDAVDCVDCREPGCACTQEQVGSMHPAIDRSIVLIRSNPLELLLLLLLRE